MDTNTDEFSWFKSTYLMHLTDYNFSSYSSFSIFYFVECKSMISWLEFFLVFGMDANTDGKVSILLFVLYNEFLMRIKIDWNMTMEFLWESCGIESN